MRIAVNTRLLLPHRLDGIGWFTAETLRRIVKGHPEHDFFFLFDRKPDSQFLFSDNVHPVVLVPQARHPLLWYLFFEWSVTHALRKYKIDLFLSPDGWTSLRTDVPTLDVIHDLNFEHAADFLRPSHQRYMKRYFPHFAAKSLRVATVSEFSKQDIATTYGIEPSKIDVVYDGAHENYHTCTMEEVEATRREYSDGRPYFIFVGTVSKRKNLLNTLKAFEKMKTDHKSDDMLIVAGRRVGWSEDLKETFESMQYAKDVRFLDHVEVDVLARLVGSATALVYVSLFEGFGIPILEAFCAGTPVVTADVTSMPEVAGDAALLVNPLDVDAIADAMYRVCSDADLRASLVKRGHERSTLFSWDRTALLLWESMMQTWKDSQSAI